MEVKEATAPPNIYPPLPVHPDQYRYSKILTIERELKEEEIKYTRLLKNYKKGAKATRITTHVLNGLTVASSAAAISTVSSGLGIIISLPLAGVGGLCSLISGGINFIGNKLQKKREKHKATVEIVKTSLMNLNRLTGKLIADGRISQEEFETVIELEKNYYSRKDKARQRESKDELREAYANGQADYKKSLLKKLE